MSDPPTTAPSTARPRCRPASGDRSLGRTNRHVVWTRIVVVATGTSMVLAGIGLGVGSIVAPDATERAYGTVKVTAGRVTASLRERVTGDVPTVRLGVAGDVAELDRCDGTFTHMTAYAHEGVPEVWAAHNNCGGDVVLPWAKGQRLRVAGSDQVYEVVDIRQTSKIWATTDDIVGLEGDLALQTCHYGEDKMKFLGLRAVEAN